MPLKAKMIDGKARVIESKTGNIATNKGGTPVDGGGHSSLGKAKEQATAVNLSQLRDKK